MMTRMWWAALLAAALAVPAGARAREEGLPPATAPAPAAPALDLSLSYVLDLGIASDGSGRVHRLDRLDLAGEFALERIGWRGARAFVRLLGTTGTRPNDGAATLQGINNVEVPADGLRPFEAWVEQDLGGGSIRAGAYDLNSEFYATESSGLLLAPQFGIGSELAATGSSGPSIYPYSALGLRAEARLGGQGVVRAALLNAEAGTLTDRWGMDTSFRSGVLAIAEVGREGPGGRLTLGGWTYSRRHDRHGPEGEGRGRSRGRYVLVERGFGERVTGFLRAGLSDGRTSPFRGSWQAGFHVGPAPFGSPDSELAVGFHQAFLSAGERALIRAGDARPARSESGVEVSVRERLFGPVTVQPSLQLVRHPGGLAERRPLVAGTLRLGLTL